MKKLIILPLSIVMIFATYPSYMSDYPSEKDIKIEFDDFLINNDLDLDAHKYLTKTDLDDIFMIINENGLDDTNKLSLINSWINFKQSNKNYSTIPQEARPTPLPDDSKSLLEQNVSILSATSLTDQIHSWDDSGVHYMVRSNPGYNKATGYFTLPSVYVNQSLGTNHDVPYGFFGMYAGSEFGMDLGVGYDVDSANPSKWFMCISGYYKTQSGTFESVWKSINIPSGVSRVYLNASVTRNSNGEVYKLDVINASTWTLIGSLSFDTLQETNSKPFYTNSTYSNLYINREVSLAFPKNSARLPNTGSYLKNAFWDQIYLYSPSGYYIWGTSLTEFASRIGKTTAFINTVTVTSTTKWSTDTTTIQY